jgi:hypothetical protein
MATDLNPLDRGGDDPQQDSAAPGPEAEENDTEGQMMIPDGTGRHLARDREQDIRRHLADRQLERSAQQARKRK